LSLQVKAKTITEIHSEAEKTLGLRPGATASIRNNRGLLSTAPGTTGPGGFPINRPGTGGMMPGMPGTRRMPGMPGIDNDNREIPRNRPMPRVDGLMQLGGRVQSPMFNKSSLNTRLLPEGSGGFIGGRSSALLHGSGGPPSRPSNSGLGAEPPAQASLPSKTLPASSVPPVSERPVVSAARVNPDELRRKTLSLLKEYFSVLLLDEALQCVEELKSPGYHPEVVKEAIFIALEANPPCVEPVAKLLEYLFSKKVLTAKDIGTGCLLYGSMLDDIGIDLPKAPKNFGEIIGKLVLVGALDFKMVIEILKKMEYDMYRRAMFDAAIRVIISSPDGQLVLDTQASTIEACRSLF